MGREELMWREDGDVLLLVLGDRVLARVVRARGGWEALSRLHPGLRDAMAAAGEAVGVRGADALPVLPLLRPPEEAWCPSCRRSWRADPRSGLALGASPRPVRRPRGAVRRTCTLCETLSRR